MRLRIPESRLSLLLPVATLCTVAILSGFLLWTHMAEESNLATDIAAVAVNRGDRLVAYARIVNNEGEDLNYTYHLVLSDSSGRDEEYSRTVFLRDGCSYVLTFNLYPEMDNGANVGIRIHKGAAVEPFEEITFRFP